ncbi:hypothetical protein M3683_20710 [Metabacillus halosaccharovorans]|nr:hypothetical protein [Metabacillus halosaccharovorans]
MKLAQSTNTRLIDRNRLADLILTAKDSAINNVN